MKKITFVFSIYLMTIIKVFSYDNTNDNDLIKRNVLILPFLNSNKNQDYDFLKDTIIDALKANLINTNQFNLSNPLQIDMKIKGLGYYDEKILEPSNAVEIAKSLESDVVVVGKFITVDEKIMIQIQAIDVFTGEIVIVINKTDDLGINLLKLIDDVSKDISNKMAEKFPKVDRSYFAEMTKLLDKKNEKKEKIIKTKYNITMTNKIGIGLCTSGGGLFLSGSSILIYDLVGYSSTLRGYKENYEKTKTGFDDYNNSYNIFIGLFCSGIALSSTGLIMTLISIPLIVYQKKEKLLSFNFEYDNCLEFIISYKF
jgi:TolB-like protein